MKGETQHLVDTHHQHTHSGSSSAAMSSPVTSLFSRGHSTRSSGGSVSSIASLPLPRDSFDNYNTAKRLEDVSEEPQERDDLEGYTLVDDTPDFGDGYADILSQDKFYTSPSSSPIQPEYSLGDLDSWSTTSSGHHHPKRPRPADQPVRSSSHRFSDKFGSISRRWKNRSGAGPQLSIVTHSIPVISRSSSASSHILSPALSAISKHESHLPPSPVRATLAESLHESEVEPIAIEQRSPPHEEDSGQATTPLLPPILMQLAKPDSPIQSPLQSPSIAATPVVMSSRTSFDTPPASCLPSPPLSSRPSVVSIRQRSRANTATASPLADIPPMQLLDELADPWSIKLGHANFNIHPEPYSPEIIDMDSYTEFRANWSQARTNFAKHVARTAEHYGSTSRVYKLTNEKWTTIDDTWKIQDAHMAAILAPELAKMNGGDSTMQDAADSSAVLETPITRIVVPTIDDKSGKFPELGDGEIVGPMSVARPRAVTTSGTSPTPPDSPTSPRKRNLLKFLSDVFGRNHVSH